MRQRRARRARRAPEGVPSCMSWVGIVSSPVSPRSSGRPLERVRARLTPASRQRGIHQGAPDRIRGKPVVTPMTVRRPDATWVGMRTLPTRMAQTPMPQTPMPQTPMPAIRPCRMHLWSTRNAPSAAMAWSKKARSATTATATTTTGAQRSASEPCGLRVRRAIATTIASRVRSVRQPRLRSSVSQRAATARARTTIGAMKGPTLAGR